MSERVCVGVIVKRAEQPTGYAFQVTRSPHYPSGYFLRCQRTLCDVDSPPAAVYMIALEVLDTISHMYLGPNALRVLVEYMDWIISPVHSR